MSEDKKQSTIGVLRESKRGVEKWLKAEERAVKYEYGIKGEVWSMYGGLVEHYDRGFQDLRVGLGIPSFRDYLLERKKSGRTTNVLDLMGGDASFLRDLKNPRSKDSPPSSVDAGLCVTLVDGREKYLKEMDKRLGIDVLSGDLTSNGTWRKIDEWQRNRGVETFDLIICRGGDGLDTVPEILYPHLFKRIWKRLSRNDGVFLTQLPIAVAERIDQLAQPLKSLPGTKSYIQPRIVYDPNNFYPSVGVIKALDAPEKLI
ncbi:MAG: hypothetical protein AAB496_00280 [Patescibacteria group bacterium]